MLEQEYQDRVESGFVDNGLEWSFREVHGLDIHEQVFEVISFFFVFFFHGFDADIRNVDIRDAGVAFFEHFFAEPRIACPHVEDLVGLIDMGGDDVLEPTEALIPVEGFRVSEWRSNYLVYLSSQ